MGADGVRDLTPPRAVDRELLWREVWLGASGAADWWRRQRSFASSAAAMSLVRCCWLGLLLSSSFSVAFLLPFCLAAHLPYSRAFSGQHERRQGKGQREAGMAARKVLDPFRRDKRIKLALPATAEA